MKKVIASLVSVSILVLNTVPVQAQVPQKIVRGLKAVTSAKPTVMPKLTYPTVSVPAAAALKRLPTVQTTVPAAKLPQIPAAKQAKQALEVLPAGVERAVTQAVIADQLSLTQIQERVQEGNMDRLADKILSYPNQNVREGLLRNEFVQVAAAGYANAEQAARAAAFWRNDLQSTMEAFSSLPEGDLKALQQAYAQKDVAVSDVNAALADVAALGLYGNKEDAALILNFYRKASATPLAPLAEASAARALLRLGAQDELAQLASEAQAGSVLWKGVSEYAKKAGIHLAVAPQKTAEVQTDVFRPVLKKFGKINILAADPSKEATAIYMNVGRGTRTITPAGQEVPSAPAANVELPELNLAYDPAALQAQAFSVAGGENVSSVGAQGASSGSTLFQQGLKKAGLTQPAAQAAAQPKAAADNSGILYGGLPIPALWQSAKKAFSSVKKLFAPKNAAAAQRPALSPLEQQPASGLTGLMQRAGLYMASFVMGLEVATPVIANFGTSFGLSLSDNILVAVATYLPYSVGAFLSNWLKQKIGRKASMNLGLALMGGGFTAGVTLFGLDGSFVPQADALAHFYNILGCITLASTGGVFVHNAVGPIMTDLSAGASELSLQKRNANTEFSRALGMAASFAFPFLATKVLGMDWSFTFALPIPLVAAAALGINLSRIPNTKPVLEPKAQPAPVPAEGQRNRRAYQLTSSFQNNSYVRLFKEEKGVAALLTGLFIMNAVEMSFNNGFMFLLPSLTTDPSSQYLFGLAQFAAPFLIGRYLARNFLKWFPKNNMSIATAISAIGGLAALPLAGNVYALTAALFAAEVGISTTFTLAFARSAKNIRTQDRIISLIVASAISCAFGPMLLTHLAQGLMDAGICSASSATAAAMIGVPAVLSLLSAALFKQIERSAQPAEGVAQAAQQAAGKASWWQKLIARIKQLFGNKPSAK